MLSNYVHIQLLHRGGTWDLYLRTLEWEFKYLDDLLQHQPHPPRFEDCAGVCGVMLKQCVVALMCVGTGSDLVNTSPCWEPLGLFGEDCWGLGVGSQVSQWRSRFGGNVALILK